MVDPVTSAAPARPQYKTVAPGRRLVFRARRAQPLVPYLGLQGCRRALRGPRTCPQRRHLAAARRPAWCYPEAGEHAGRPGILLAAALALEPGLGLPTSNFKRGGQPHWAGSPGAMLRTPVRSALAGSPTWVVTLRSSSRSRW